MLPLQALLGLWDVNSLGTKPNGLTKPQRSEVRTALGVSRCAQKCWPAQVLGSHTDRCHQKEKGFENHWEPEAPPLLSMGAHTLGSYSTSALQSHWSQKTLGDQCRDTPFGAGKEGTKLSEIKCQSALFLYCEDSSEPAPLPLLPCRCHTNHHGHRYAKGWGLLLGLWNILHTNPEAAQVC